MSYKREEDTITLTLSTDDYTGLMMFAGMLLSCLDRKADKIWFWRWVKLVNRMNEGNPHYRPYETPEEEVN
jgi:hypothetical protein